MEDVLDLDTLINVEFTWSNRDKIFMVIPKNLTIRFTIFCAEQVIGILANDEHAKKVATSAISAAKAVLKDPSEYNRFIAHNAGRDADNSTDNWRHTDDPEGRIDCALLAASAAAFTATLSFTSIVSHACNAARYAALTERSNSELLKQDQMNYLRNLILESLDDEQKDNWLLVASI